MLRVLTLSTLFPDASRPNFGIFVERQALALSKRPGVAVEMVAPVGIPPWPLSRHRRYRALSALPPREDWKGLPVERPRFLNLPATGGRWHPAMLERALVPVLDAMRARFPFDAIVAEFFFPDGPAAVRLAQRYGVPVAIFARGSDIHYWGSAPHTREQLLAAARAADAMVSVSHRMRDDMIALGMPGDKIETIVTGLDHARFHPRPPAPIKQRLGVAGPLVVALGALIPIKGHEIVIDAVASLPGVSLLIAGQGPVREALQQRIARSGAADRIRLLGAVPHDEIPELAAAADVMALASASEGLANAWVEALASGTPIVIPDVGGARQVVQAPSAGRIVERTAPAFAAAIAELIAHPSPRETVAEAARDFTWENNSSRLHALIERLVRREAPAVA